VYISYFFIEAAKQNSIENEVNVRSRVRVPLSPPAKIADVAVFLESVGRTQPLRPPLQTITCKAYNTLDLALGLIQGQDSFRLYARNLRDEYAYTRYGFGYATLLQPRTVGVSADVAF
jgi:hypothetical protein